MRPDAPVAPSPLIPISRKALRPGVAAVLLLQLTMAFVALGVGTTSLAYDFPLSVYVPQILCGVAAVLMLVYLWRFFSGKPTPVILTVLTVGVLLFTGNPALTSVPLSLFFCIGAGATALAILPRSQLLWLPLPVLVGYGVTLALGRDPLAALVVLLPVPAAAVLAWATRRAAAREDGLTRVGIICLSSLTLALTAAALVAALLYRWLGTLEPAVLGQMVEDLRTALIGYISSTELPEELSDSEALQLLLSEENAALVVNSVFNVLLADIIAGLNITVAIAQLVLLDGLAVFGHGESVTDRVKAFRMSLVSGVVYLLAYVVYVIADWEASTLAGAVAQNICIILMPGLALAGLLRINATLARRGVRGSGCLFFLILLAPCFLLLAPPLLAVYEVGGQLAAHLRERLNPPDDDIFRRPPEDK